MQIEEMRIIHIDINITDKEQTFRFFDFRNPIAKSQVSLNMP